jgi:hypothetical protein
MRYAIKPIPNTIRMQMIHLSSFCDLRLVVKLDHSADNIVRRSDCLIICD